MKYSVQRIRVVCGVILGLSFLSVLMYESEVLPAGRYAGDGRAEYISLLVCVAVTLGSIYVAVTSYFRSLDKWKVALLPAIALLADIHLYYMTWQASCALCLLLTALVILLVLFVKQTKKKEDGSDISAE